MAEADRAVASRHLRMLFEAGTAVGRTDGQLLHLFQSSRNEAAFTALIERHGPMVQRVCGEVLGNHHDAEDAFQATFLVLARRAGSIRRSDSLASWLYGVALRVANSARSATARRRTHERAWAALRMDRTNDEEEPPRDLGPLLHAEIGRLAERFRAPLVLCYLEGRTYEEAARLLCCPVGTIKSRLATARLKLRNRLERLEPLGQGDRDMAVPPSLAAVPARLVEMTIQAAMQAAGNVVPHAVSKLAEGVLGVMFLHRMLTAATVVIMAGVLATGATGLAWSTKHRPAAPVEAIVDEPPQTKPEPRPTHPQPPS